MRARGHCGRARHNTPWGWVIGHAHAHATTACATTAAATIATTTTNNNNTAPSPPPPPPTSPLIGRRRCYASRDLPAPQGYEA